MSRRPAGWETTFSEGSALNSYRTLLSSRSVRQQAVTGLLAQLTQGAAAIGIILVVRESSGSLALAGGVSAALWIAGALARPLQGRFIDGPRPRALLAGCAVTHAIALAGIVQLSDLDAPGAVLLAAGAVAGASLPPVSTSMRVEWSRSRGAGERPAAYSLVYLTQQLAILTGPLVLAGVVAVGSASSALLAVAALTGMGGLGYAASLPTPEPSRDRVRRPLPGVGALRFRGLQVIFGVALLVGATIGSLEIAAPTLANRHHAPAAAGLLIACLSVGGVLGAALYTRSAGRAQAAARPLVLLSIITAALALMIAADGLVLAGVLFLGVGVALNPLLTTFSLLVDSLVPAQVAGEAFGWLSTAVAGGGGLASMLAALVAQELNSPRGALVVAAGAAAAGTALAALARRTLSPPADLDARGSGRADGP